MGLFDFFKKKETVNEITENKRDIYQPPITLESFFNIDIHDVLKHLAIFETGDNEYLIRLNTPELGIFNRLRVIYFPKDKQANLQFKSDNMIVSEQLKELLAFFTDKYGIDNVANRGYFEDWEQGMISFMRLWPNAALVSAVTGHIELTLFGVYQN